MTVRSAVNSHEYEGTGEPKPPMLARDIFWVRALAVVILVVVLTALIAGGMAPWLIRKFFMFGFPIALFIWSVRRFKSETRWSISWFIIGMGIPWWLGAAILWSDLFATESALLMFFVAWPSAVFCAIWAICLPLFLDWWEERR